IGEQAYGHAALAQQAVELGNGRVIPSSRHHFRLIQIHLEWYIPHQGKVPLARLCRRTELACTAPRAALYLIGCVTVPLSARWRAPRHGRPQLLFPLGNVQPQSTWQRLPHVEPRRVEAQHLLEQRRQVRRTPFTRCIQRRAPEQTLLYLAALP